MPGAGNTFCTQPHFLWREPTPGHRCIPSRAYRTIHPLGRDTEIVRTNLGWSLSRLPVDTHLEDPPNLGSDLGCR